MVDRTEVFTGLESEVELLPDLALQHSWRAVQEVRVPLESCLARQPGTILGGGVVEREGGWARAAVVLGIVSVVEGAHVDAALVGEVKDLPS